MNKKATPKKKVKKELISKPIEIVIGYKGTDKNLKCRDFQFEVGKKYKHDGKVEPCASGFHFCTIPFDVFNYYSPSESRFFKVVGSGETKNHDLDSKIASSDIEIQSEISLQDLVNDTVKNILDNVIKTDEPQATNTGNKSAATNTGDYSAATNTGNQSAATNTGNKSAATNTGNQSAATNTGNQSAATNTGNQSAATNTGFQSAATIEGKESVAMSIGIEGRAKGKIGCWLVLSEWKKIKNKWCRIDVQSVKVDGKKIKEDTFYQLRKGKFVEVKEQE